MRQNLQSSRFHWTWLPALILLSTAATTLAQTIPTKAGNPPRITARACRVQPGDASVIVDGERWQSSGDVTGLTGANALIQLAGNSSAPKPDEAVQTLLIEVP